MTTAAYAIPARSDLEQAVSAVLYGTVGTSAPTYTGVSKDEALEYAADLAHFVKHLLAEPHLIDLRDDGWTIQHPMSCRIDGTLFDCPVNRAAEFTLSEPPDELGRFTCRASTAGILLIGDRCDT